jgi:hypothetical protein
MRSNKIETIDIHNVLNGVVCGYDAWIKDGPRKKMFWIKAGDSR